MVHIDFCAILILCYHVCRLCIHACIWVFVSVLVFFFFKQKTAYEMRISDWSSDVCSSDLGLQCFQPNGIVKLERAYARTPQGIQMCTTAQLATNVLSQSAYISTLAAFN